MESRGNFLLTQYVIHRLGQTGSGPGGSSGNRISGREPRGAESKRRKGLGGGVRYILPSPVWKGWEPVWNNGKQDGTVSNKLDRGQGCSKSFLKAEASGCGSAAGGSRGNPPLLETNTQECHPTLGTDVLQEDFPTGKPVCFLSSQPFSLLLRGP